MRVGSETGNPGNVEHSTTAVEPQAWAQVIAGTIHVGMQSNASPTTVPTKKHRAFDFYSKYQTGHTSSSQFSNSADNS